MRGQILILVALFFVVPAILRTQSVPRVNGDRVIEHLNAIGAIGKNPGGGYDRIAYTEADRQGREYVMGLMRAAGLDTRVDAAGNISGRRAGREPGLPVLMLGSHVDSVPREETTTGSSVRWARSRLLRSSRNASCRCGIRWRLSSFKTRKAD